MNFRAHFIALLTVAWAASVGAQRPDSLSGELRQTFREVRAIRERPDGRVLILDSHEMIVAIADFRTGMAQQVGLQGMGEREYLWPSRLFPLPGDTTLVWDAIEGRIHVFTESLGVIEPRGTLKGRISRPDGTPFNPMMSDRQGRLYTIFDQGHTTALLRLDRTTTRLDTVANVPARTVLADQMFPSVDRWIVGENGTVAYVHMEPFGVDLYAPNAPAIRGDPIPFTPTLVSPAIRSALLAWMHKPRPVWTALGGGRYGFVDDTDYPVVDYGAWPLVLPPVLGVGFIGFASDGTLLIERLALPGMPSEYDVVGQRGELVDRFQLAANTQIVATGNRTVYVTIRGSDGRLRLQRFTTRPRP